MINSREDIKDFIVSIEKNHNVNGWKINDVCLWPTIRIRLYFYLIHKIDLESVSKKNIKEQKNLSFLRKTIYKSKRYIPKNLNVYKNYFFWKRQLSQKDFLFLSHNNYRVNYKGKRYNRFFDVIIDKYDLKNNSMFFEYDSLSISNKYNSKLLYNYDKALDSFSFFFKFKIAKSELVGYDLFLEFLSKNKLTENFSKLNNIENIDVWAQKKIIPKIEFFRTVLKKIKPKKIFVLCYYSEDMMSLMVAANKLGIETIEMQHGPQTLIHLAYGNWTCVPQRGYDMLPRNYWCWDVYSKKVLDNWINKSPLYNSIVGGNPWVDYWKNKQSSYLYNNFILYSLQPSPLTLSQLFNEEIISFIKEYPYYWFIRIHPRQLLEIDKIKLFLEKKGVLDLVNIDNATYDPLPQLLSNAKIHITHFSGTTIEASLFGKKTVLLNEVAINSFPNLIATKKAVFLNLKEVEFSNKLHQIIEYDNSVIIDENFKVPINSCFFK